MSIRVKFQSPVPSIFPSTPVDPPTAYHPPRPTEAPDRGEARPESRDGLPREAPDAGYGRSEYLEHEFTHGRSQS